jgi:hypothetical protein
MTPITRRRFVQLAEIKKKYDPTKVLALNPNIKPA